MKEMLESEDCTVWYEGWTAVAAQEVEPILNVKTEELIVSYTFTQELLASDYVALDF